MIKVEKNVDEILSLPFNIGTAGQKIVEGSFSTNNKNITPITLLIGKVCNCIQQSGNT